MRLRLRLRLGIPSITAKGSPHRPHLGPLIRAELPRRVVGSWGFLFALTRTCPTKMRETDGHGGDEDVVEVRGDGCFLLVGARRRRDGSVTD